MRTCATGCDTGGPPGYFLGRDCVPHGNMGTYPTTSRMVNHAAPRVNNCVPAAAATTSFEPYVLLIKPQALRFKQEITQIIRQLLQQRLLQLQLQRREAPPLEQLHDELYFAGEGVKRRLDGHGQPFVNTWPRLVLLR